MPLKDAVEEIVKSVVENVQQEIEKRLAAIVDEKLAEVKEEIVELAKQRVVEAIVAELRGERPALAPAPAVPTVKPITLTKIDAFGHIPIYRELLEVTGKFGKGRSFSKGEAATYVNAQLKGAKYWNGLAKHTQLDYLWRHLSYLKAHGLAKSEHRMWSIVPGIEAGLIDLFAKKKVTPATKKEVVKKEKKPKAELSELTKIDYIEKWKRPIYKEIASSIIGICKGRTLKKKEFEKELDKKLAGSAWENLSPSTKRGYISAHLSYMRTKGALKLEHLRWSALPGATAKISS